MMLRHPAAPQGSVSPTEAWLHARAAALADALLARGVERDQAARLAVAMLEACAARRTVAPPRPA